MKQIILANIRKPFLFSFALLCITILLPLACKKIVRNEAHFEAVSQYVYAFTSGSIGREEPIRVRFVNAAVSQAQVGQSVDPDVLNISPSISGKPVWEDDRTIVLQPTEPLPYGQEYQAVVNIGKIYKEAPANGREFQFRFTVRELSFDVATHGLRTEDPMNLRRQQITGSLLTSDQVPNETVEKLLTANQGNKTLPITWNHHTDGVTHDFVVQEVERSNVRSNVKLEWNGQPLGSSRTGRQEVIVPALDEFAVLAARVEQIEEQYILVNFSDPLSPSQDLAGLVRIEGDNNALRTVIDGNFLRIYPSERIVGNRGLRIEAGIRNTAGASLKERFDIELAFEDLQPAVRLVGRGAIIPQENGGAVLFPFEAVGLTAVDVEVFKVFNANILQHLQVNEIEGERELNRVGKIILQKKVVLRDLNPEAQGKVWQRYALDLREVIRQDPAALYQVRIAFRRTYVIQECQAVGTGAEDAPNQQLVWEAEEEAARLGRTDEYGNLISIVGGYRGLYFDELGNGYTEENEYWYGDENDYDWSNRDNPCFREYYNHEHFAQRNVFVSDLGITGKRGRDGSMFFAATDLHTAQQVAGVNLQIYNYQLQPIGQATTGADGTVLLEKVNDQPFIAVASQGNRRGYLRMVDGNSLSLSRFDVGGVELQKGLKGYIYGERGVWRPGDSIYLNFVLEDKAGSLPSGHPVVLQLTDPRGALQQRVVATKGVNGVYALHTATRPEAPTGNWTASVSVGGANFFQTLKIETVKPNRLKLDLDFGKKELSGQDAALAGTLKVNWLHGAVAKNLKAKVEMNVRPTTTTFPNFKDFVFDDPARSYYSEPQVLFDDKINDQGIAKVPLKLAAEKQAPGKLIANFRVRAFEAGGDFSTDNFALDYHMYNSYVGVAIPVSRWGDKTLDQRGGTVQFAVVDKTGRPVVGRTIQVAVYRTDWRWWWDEDSRSGVAQFNSSGFSEAIDQAELKTDQRGLVSWKVKPITWGRYLVRAIDEESGHATGDFFWSGYPSDLNDIKSRNAAAMLPFSVEKEKYNVGDEVVLKVPASESGRILLTLESGARVTRHIWFDAKAGDNMLKFQATEEMAPTIYAHVSLIQPHAQTKNDLPIRMYGVMPVHVENQQTRLQPVLEMPQQIRPDETFTVSVREGSGKGCAYTLAVVDEGLLDLTRFQTPNPWNAFFAREALGVKTWDIYDYVLGVYGAQLERILSVGGDGINQKAKNAAQVNRFKPAVIHLGPFYLAPGQTAKHNLKIENYVGSVRAMVVASAPASNGKGAYGSAEKAVPVRKAVMVMPTLPRVLSPGESLKLPVEVFAMEKQVKTATVRVKETSGLIDIGGGGTKTLEFSEPGNQLTNFDLKVGKGTGVAKFIVTVQGGGESSSQEIELLVRNPNPVVSEVIEGVMDAGGEWTGRYDPSKYTNIESALVEVSVLPSINLSRHLEYLIRYPYGCVEQTVSAAFPQLYVDILKPLTAQQQTDVKNNILAALNRLRDFQNASGTFSYWPGSEEVNDWSAVYAGHFLIEAKAKGYTIPAGMLENWMSRQAAISRQWVGIATTTDSYQSFDNDLTQAYRLYTLALGGKPDIANMNRMREKKDLFRQSAMLLAAGYALGGKPEVAQEIARNEYKKSWTYNWCGYTYGSDLRDQSLLLETNLVLGNQGIVENLVREICQNLGNSSNPWYHSTQSLSTALRALSKYAKNTVGTAGAVYAYRIGSGGALKNGDSFKLAGLVDLSSRAMDESSVTIKNNSAGKLYARLVLNARPTIGSEKQMANNLAISVRYFDMKGTVIDPVKLSQGTDFIAEVTVKRQSTFNFPFNELALEQVFPAGWEILNTRMQNVGNVQNSPMDYQDVRDDRVFTFFDIPQSSSKNKWGDSRVYRMQLNAAYSGRYYLPAVSCNAMYDNRINASTTGRWIEVI